MTSEAKIAAYVSGAVLDALWQRFGGDSTDEHALDADYEEWKAVAVAAVEALPVSEPAASARDSTAAEWVRTELEQVIALSREAIGQDPSGVAVPVPKLRALLADVDRLTAELASVSEAGENPETLRVLRAWWARVTDAHYESCATGGPDGGACDCTATSEGEYALAASAYEVAYVTHQREAARDLAFRAAFADEEGGEVQWGVRFTYPDGREVLVSAVNEQHARQAAAEVLQDKAATEVVRWTVSPPKPVSP